MEGVNGRNMEAFRSEYEVFVRGMILLMMREKNQILRMVAVEQR
jgi:hypothetical protein